MIRFLGLLRFSLLVIAALLVVSAPFAESPAQYHGFPLYSSVIAPVLAPMMFFVMPIDMTMCWVMKKENRNNSAGRYAKIIKIEALLMLILLLAWLPFIRNLTST